MTLAMASFEAEQGDCLIIEEFGDVAQRGGARIGV